MTLIEGPTTTALLEPVAVLPALPAEDGEEPAAVWLGEEPVVEEEEEMKGLESEDSTAAVRSNSNWRVLVI